MSRRDGWHGDVLYVAFCAMMRPGDEGGTFTATFILHARPTALAL
jgi:hypothetical protein